MRFVLWCSAFLCTLNPALSLITRNWKRHHYRLICLLHEVKHILRLVYQSAQHKKIWGKLVMTFVHFKSQVICGIELLYLFFTAEWRQFAEVCCENAAGNACVVFIFLNIFNGVPMTKIKVEIFVMWPNIVRIVKCRRLMLGWEFHKDAGDSEYIQNFDGET